jgi:iron complex outermembrane recepter protein
MSRTMHAVWIAYLALSNLGSLATAQDNSSSGDSVALTEIVVTATRRQENLQDVPISVSVVSAAQVENLGIISSQDVALLTPGLTFGSEVLYGQPYIRGVGSSLTTLGTESSVAMYIDGVYQARQYSLVQNLNDIDHIEVLKGPQGDLYGRNATGGAISITTKAPEPGFSGNIEVTGGNYDEKGAKLYVTGGTDTLSASFAGYVLKHNGYYKNLVTGDSVEQENDFGGMVKVRWRVNDRNSLTLSFDASNDEGDVGAFASQFGTNNVTAVLYPGSCYPFTPHDTCADQQQRIAANNWQRSRGGTALWLSEFDDFDFRVTSGVRNINSASAIDVDASSAPIIYFANQGPRGNPNPGEEFNMWSIEPVLTSKGNGPFSWLLGGMYYRDGGHLLVTIDALNLYAQETADSSLAEAYAAFAQGGYRFGPDERWKASVGVRYSDEKKEIYDATQFLYLGGYESGTATPSTGFPNEEKSWNDVTGSASLSYDLGGATAYGRWAQGFKSGAFNLNDPGTPAVNPEKINSYELGIKSLLAGGRLELNGAGFYYDYKDIQLESINSQTGGSFTQNAASAKVRGLEGDTRARITTNFQAQLGISLLDAKYSNFPHASVTAPCADYGLDVPENCTPGTAPIADVPPPNLAGKQMVEAPKIGVNGAVEYAIPVSFGKFDLDALANHSGRYYFDPLNRLQQHPYTVVNASVTLHSLNDQWFFRVWSNNLTNANYVDYISPVQFGDFGHWEAPRTFGGTVGFNFK